MTTISYILGIISTVTALFVVIEMLKRRKLRERHASWWLFAGSLAVLVSVFPQILQYASRLLGIEIPTNLIFFVSIAVLFFVNLQHSAELTELEEKTRRLSEEVALLRNKIDSVVSVKPKKQSTSSD